MTDKKIKNTGNKVQIVSGFAFSNSFDHFSCLG